MNRINSAYYKDLPDNLSYSDDYGKSILVKYSEAYTECIIHFHHFAELVRKNFLRHDNPLFVDYPSNDKNIVLKYNIIKNELSLEDENNVKTTGFLETLKALLELIHEKSLKNNYYNEQLFFLTDCKEMLETLNALRNKVWHRGLYILNHEALDELVGRYILPFMDKVTKHKTYSLCENLWKHEQIDCGIDPIQEIINHFENESYNKGKIAFLKELGRAAYNAKLYWYWLYNNAKEIIEKKAIVVSQDKNGSEICKCPVCGVNSLVIYIYEDDDSSWPFIARCECCSFEINLDDDIKNASEYGIEGIRDYWM